MIRGDNDLKTPAFLRGKRPKKIRAKAKRVEKGRRRGHKNKSKPKPKKAKAKKKKLSPKAKKVPKKQIAPNPILIGEITHYFGKIKVAIILIKQPINKNQSLDFDGLNNFKQKIDSMQFNHEEITTAKKGQEVGIKVKKALKPGDKAYLSI